MGVVRYNWGIAPGNRSEITGRVREGGNVTLKVLYAVVTLGNKGLILIRLPEKDAEYFSELPP